MQTRLHLLSMPMHDPLHPSTQLGYLQGHVERTFAETLEVRSYSAHTQILYALEGAGMTEYFSAHRLFGEELFFLACCQAYPRLFERVYPRYMDFLLPEVHVTREHINALCEVMRAYLRARLLPQLAPNTLNVIGMTTTFAQLFASIFAAKYVREHSDADVLFVFGGATMALPEANRVLELWGISGLIVTGAGESPLSHILRTCLDLDSAHSKDALDRIGARGLTNVTCIGAPPKPIDLTLTRSELAGIGDPNYDEFFANLRSLCSTEDIYDQLLELVAIPLEGSRGCFARCDFCQNPNITTVFRTLTGHEVAARARRLVTRYRTPRLYFADSVCNSWAEDYADDLLATGDQYEAFMEMRVHAPQAFFAKLALAGVDEMQLGIESISSPLLRAMRKGTTVLQNLRAAKYLSELGIRSSSNLITHHPKSTIADIEETKRVIQLIPHFPHFCLSHFAISYASPIYNQLTAAQLAELTRGFTWLPEDLREYTLVRDLAYPYPQEWLDPAVNAGWGEFRRWYTAFQASTMAILDAERHGSEVHVHDTRFGTTRQHVLEGDLACVHDLCHAGPTLESMIEMSNLSAETCSARLAELIDLALVIESEGRYLALARRPRAELIKDLSTPAHRVGRSPRPLALPVLTEIQ